MLPNFSLVRNRISTVNDDAFPGSTFGLSGTWTIRCGSTGGTAGGRRTQL